VEPIERSGHIVRAAAGRGFSYMLTGYTQAAICLGLVRRRGKRRSEWRSPGGELVDLS